MQPKVVVDCHHRVAGSRTRLRPRRIEHLPGRLGRRKLPQLVGFSCNSAHIRQPLSAHSLLARKHTPCAVSLFPLTSNSFPPVYKYVGPDCRHDVFESRLRRDRGSHVCPLLSLEVNLDQFVAGSACCFRAGYPTKHPHRPVLYRRHGVTAPGTGLAVRPLI